MRLFGFLQAGLVASLFAAVPALAQTQPDQQKPETQQAQKQQTQGGAAFEPPQYGGAQKQHTQGGAAFEPQQYGSDWSRARKQAE